MSPEPVYNDLGLRAVGAANEERTKKAVVRARNWKKNK